MELARKGREKVEMYQEIQKLGFSRFESKYYVKKAYSLKGQILGKDIHLSFIIYGDRKNLSDKKKSNKIKKVFKESGIISKLIELKVNKKKIEEYAQECSGILGTPIRYLLEHTLDEIDSKNLYGKRAEETIEKKLFEYSSTCFKEDSEIFHNIA